MRGLTCEFDGNMETECVAFRCAGLGLLGGLEGEDLLPVVFHADDGPAFGDRFVPAFVELLQFVRPIVGAMPSLWPTRGCDQG